MRGQETTYVPGNQGGAGFYDSWGRDRYMGTPGYVITDTIATIQTNIYDVTSGKLIWTGNSETFNPEDVRTVVRDIAKAIGAELRKEGLLPA